MLSFKKLKRIPTVLPCLLALTWIDRTYGTGMKSCDGSIAANASTICTGASNAADEYCLNANGLIFKSELNGPSCSSLELSKNYLFNEAGTALATMSSTTTGLLYVCGDTSCEQITSGYFLTTDGGDASGTTLYLYNCNESSCKKVTEEGYYPKHSKDTETCDVYFCDSSSACSCKTSSDLNVGYYGYGAASSETFTHLFSYISSLNDVPNNDIIDGYYLSGADYCTGVDNCTANKYAKVFNCKNKSCTLEKSTTAGYYLTGQGYTPSNYINLLQCTLSSGKCEFSLVTASATDGDYYYISATEAGKIYKCTASSSAFTKCESITGESRAGYAYVNGVATTTVITCKGGTCKETDGGAKQAASAAPVQNAAFLDAGNAEPTKNMIICTNTDTVACASKAVPNSSQGYAYLDGTSLDDQNKITNLITCTSGGVCNPLGDETPSQIDGRAYIDAGSVDASGKYLNIIKCTGDACSVETGALKTTGAAYIDAITTTNIITCDGTSGCVSAANGSTDSEDHYYISGTNPKKYIKCTKNDGCSTDVANSSTTDAKYYPDSNNPANIITCTNASSDCSSVTAINAPNGYYVSGFDSGSILGCDITNGCKPLASVSSADLTGYINFDTKSIIMCSPKTSAASKRTGEASTTPIECAVQPEIESSDTKSYYYVAGDDSSKIITCKYDSGASKCDTTTVSTTETGKSMAYFNEGAKKVIQCDTVSGGKVCTPKGPTEEITKTNYIEATAKTNIITCEAGEACTSTTAALSTTGAAYIDYVNKGNVIKCPTSGNCASAPSTPVAATGTDPVQNCNYLDGYDTDNKTIITCTKEGTDISCNSTAIETFIEGHAYMDCSGENEFAQLLKHKVSTGSGILEIIATGDLKASGDGFAYIDGSDADKKRIITCTSGECATKNNGSSAAVTTPTPKDATNAFYIDGVTNTKIIVCNPGSGCVAQDGVKQGATLDGYYVDSLNTGKIIKCLKDGTKECSNNNHNGTANVPTYYLDAYDVSKVLKCPNGAICEEVKGITTPGFGYVDTATTGQVIVCKSGSGENDPATCSSIPSGANNSASPAVVTGFIDADVNNSKSILVCSNAAAACVPTVPTATQGFAYLDGTSKDENGAFTNVITCDMTTETFSSLSATDKKPVTEEGFVYIDAGSTGPVNIIKCTANGDKITCVPEAGKNGTEFAYLDASDTGTPTKKVIACPTNCESKNNTATAEVLENGEVKTPAVNIFYINGVKDSKIIVCTAKDGCSIIDGNTTTDTNKYYPDSETADNIIKCTATTVVSGTTTPSKCTSSDHTGTDGDAYYIDGYYPNKILICNTTDGCVSTESLATENQPTYYVDAGGEASKPVMITCTPKECTSGPGVTEPGTAYMDPIDKKNIIVCGSATAACTAPAAGVVAGTSDTYIDAGDFSQVLSCNATTCSYFATKPSEAQSEYYARLTTGTGVNKLIECDYNATVTKKSVCKLEETNAPKANYVYINSLFGKENGDNTNPLIICDSSSQCKPNPAKITGQNKSYYINSDLKSVNNTLNADIIECTEANKQCSILPGKATDVYLNANFDATNNNKQIIMCTQEDGCLEYATNSNATDFRYYVNAGSMTKKWLNDTLIECKDSCAILTTAKDGDIYINEFDTSQTIQCYEEKGCVAVKSQATEKKNEIFKNSSDLDQPENEPLTKDLIKCVNSEGSITCSAEDGKEDEVYVNSYNTTEIIYCKSDGCKTKASEALPTQPEYYINADTTDEEKLDGDLIKCKNNGSKVTCEVTKGGDGDVYLNANVENDSNKKPLIMCSKDVGCTTDTSKATTSESLPAYYVNAGSVLSSKLNDTLIECNFGTDTADCGIKQALANEVYRNYGNNTDTHQLIKCNNNGCKVAISSATDKSNEYYLNSGDNDETALDYDIIECSSNGESIECVELEETGEGVYINSNYSENGDSNQLILCRSDSGCEGVKTSPKGSNYFVNAEASDLNNAIIFCSNKKCEKQTPNGTPVYYVGTTQEGEVNGLIECAESEVVADTSTPSTASGRKRATEEKCKLKSAFTSNGYFLNAGYNKSINQTIICDSTNGCATQKVDLGYYVNAGDEAKPIIKCEKEGSECLSEESKDCPEASAAIPGNYCYGEGLLKFFPQNNSTALAASKSDDVYTFATIPAGGFPGIKSETGALFKISRYFINRFYQSGVVMIDKNGKLVDNLLSNDQSDIQLYDCNDTTKTCSVRPGCTPNTYMFDSENKKAVFCNSGKLEYAEFTGYVVDGNRAVGANHPYIIECQNNGKKCKSIKPKASSYYENSGYDASTNSLIECSNNNCVTKSANVGYYVGHEGEGIIQCTSSTSCNYTKSKSKVKYVNAGSNKTSNAIISCSKNNCSTIKAYTGYYLTYTSSLLIQCTSPSNCVEFTPTVNYYDNADSSESSNTIINCTQNSQVVTCAQEATNNGYYISSIPNVLIRCKFGDKCKTIKVKNGIFRGAIKSLTGGGSKPKRTDEDSIELEEDGKSVAMPRDSDDSYDIIRCIQEKCSALSPSEVSAIPICEFNNNKCYITLEYAMTKSATTSISAGNICTNNDRSVFYFATDTIVVKPNVISGVTATYVYTTTNSNCLEVNDSYSDMYFTVGSSVYLLDQGSVVQFYEQGYYFFDTAKNVIVNGNDIDSYNDENVKLYICNGNSCSIMDKPDSLTYFVDVNKRILRYDVNSDSYSFAYEKDITCIFANNKCTPNADLKNREFCVTYKGEIALAKQDIKNRETGECYKANTIGSTIYGFSQYLYNMNMYSAQMIDETGYYIVSLSTNTTAVSKNYKTKNSNIVIYGCQLSSCKVVEPDENTYYYDAHAKNILRYKDGVWKTPSSSGYAYVSIDPANTYIYRFTKNGEEVKINAIANKGYYYTVDGEMYQCDRDEDGACVPIENTGYYFTNAGEVYYCVHDSEEIEPTECTKQACVSGQYYYIEDAYYRCESSSTLVPVMSRFCSYNENVVVNFPIALTEEYPEKIKQAVEGIEKNNNSTAVISRRGKNYLESVSGIFTNCTYNVEETKSTFDLVCVNNFVTVDGETDDVKICSMEQLGYVECIEDEENPEKCNISGGFARISLSVLTVVMATILSILLY